MKAGVITFHSAHNFGASLQTWALQQALLDLGVEPCVINYHTPVIDNLYDPIKETDPRKRAKKSNNYRRKIQKAFYAMNVIVSLLKITLLSLETTPVMRIY